MIECYRCGASFPQDKLNGVDSCIYCGGNLNPDGDEFKQCHKCGYENSPEEIKKNHGDCQNCDCPIL